MQSHHRIVDGIVDKPQSPAQPVSVPISRHSTFSEGRENEASRQDFEGPRASHCECAQGAGLQDPRLPQPPEDRLLRRTQVREATSLLHLRARHQIATPIQNPQPQALRLAEVATGPRPGASGGRSAHLRTACGKSVSLVDQIVKDSMQIASAISQRMLPPQTSAVYRHIHPAALGRIQDSFNSNVASLLMGGAV